MFYVEPHHIDEAWQNGASALALALEKADGDITAEQLVQALKAGKKTLLGHNGGWAVVEVQMYPNKRVLHVDAIHAPGVTGADVFEELKAFAAHNGCAQIQGACQPSVARLWKRKGFKESFTILRYTL